MEILELKEKVVNFREQSKNKVNISWPMEIKEAVLSLYAKGESTKNLAKLSSLPHQTIYTWVHRPVKNKKKLKEKNFKAIDVISSAVTETSLTLTWPGHCEVSGLNFEQFRDLLREGLL